MEKDEDSYEKEEDKDKGKSKSKKKSTSNDLPDSSDNKKDKDNLADTDKTNHDEERGLDSFFDTTDIKNDEIHDDIQDEFDDIPNLSEEELHEATLAIVDARMQEVTDELAVVAPDSPEEFEALADAVFLESLQDLAEGDDTISRDLIDDAFVEALEDLSIPEETISENENEDELHDMTENQPTLDTDNDNQIVPVQASAAPATAVNAVNPQSPPPPTSNGVQLSNSSPSPSTPRQSNYYASQNTPNTPAQQFNTNPVVVNEIFNHRSDMLVGAILGYIIGRRGGRKRTEKKLQPKITKLEKQVSDLHYVITDKEEKIRTLARQKVEEYERRKREEAKNQNSGAVQIYKTSVADEVIERRIIKKKVKEQLKRRKELAEDPSVEKIGRFSLPALKVFHEKRLPDGSENNVDRKQVEVMTEAELLDKITGLKIHDLNVAYMYERKRLTLESLRQITKEYLRGGPFKQTFFIELLPDEQEIAEKKQQVHEVYGKTQTANNYSSDTPSQPKMDVRQTTKLTEELLAKPSKTEKNYTNSNVKYGVIAGITLAFIILFIILTV